INPWKPAFDPAEFGPKGKVYDGWETRRRREPGNDWAIVRLGAAGVVRGVVVDTAWFTGNYPPEISVEATHLGDYPSAAQLDTASWTPLVTPTPCAGDSPNYYVVDDERCWTHVRLSIYPDGGVARLRVHGVVLPRPDLLDGTIDLVAAATGGQRVRTYDAFYTSPAPLIFPCLATSRWHGRLDSRRSII